MICVGDYKMFIKKSKVHKKNDKTMKYTILWELMFENPIIELANKY